MFGLEKFGQPAVKDARAGLTEGEMRLAGILDTLLTRLGQTRIIITIDIPRAGDDWPKTPPAPEA